MSAAKHTPRAAEPHMHCIGASHDGRTNRWRVECVCGKDFDPPTTRLSRSTVTCPRCVTVFNVNYNEKTITKATGEQP